MAQKRRAPFQIANSEVRAGSKARFKLPISKLVSGSEINLPLLALHGRRKGPVLWLSAAIHGDEICGTEIIRQVLLKLDPKTLAGTVIAVPVVNVHGFNTNDRYLPDRRDLNRSFPGSARGSLAARIAHLVMVEVVSRSDYGIDLHTGSDRRRNLPQLRADLDDAATLDLARKFGTPIIIHARTRDGSLREAATQAGATTLLYEAGEASRFDTGAIRTGVRGVLRTMVALDMIEHEVEPPEPALLSRKTRWTRATQSGILNIRTKLGNQIERGERVATMHDPFGKRIGRINARTSGVVIGLTQNPLANRGDAVAHIAAVEHPPAPQLT